MEHLGSKQKFSVSPKNSLEELSRAKGLLKSDLPNAFATLMYEIAAGFAPVAEIFHFDYELLGLRSSIANINNL